MAFAAGGFADHVSRLISQKLNERWGQPFIVDNRGGAGGNIASKNVVDAAPDGYTLLVHTAALSINASLYKDLGFDVERDLVPVAISGSAPGAFTVAASHPANNPQELLKRARDSGKPIAFATAGVGTSSHLAAEYLFVTLAGVKATFASQGTDVHVMSQAEFAGKLKNEIALWRKIVTATGAKPE